MVLRIILVLLFIFVLGCSRSELSNLRGNPKTVLPQCQKDSVKTINIPIFPDRESSPLFPYSFEFIFKSSNQPTIFYLPGGPGGTSIGESVPISENFNIVKIDPRGLGCNEIKPWNELPEGFWSTKLLALDVISVIKYLNLDDYMLYGKSYGTMEGTIIAGLAEQGAVKTPKAVVYDGTLGRADIKQQELGVIKRWNILKNKLPQSITEKMAEGIFPFDFPQSDWVPFIELHVGADIKMEQTLIQKLNIAFDGQEVEKEKIKNEIIFWKLYSRKDNSEVPFTKEQLRNIIISAVNLQEPLSETDEKEIEAIIEKIIAGTDPNVITNEIVMNKTISCEEIIPVEYGLELLNGELHQKQTNGCANYQFRSPFDSKEWPFSGNTYYFEGKIDTNTYEELSRYHFDHQYKSFRIRIVDEELGHGVLQNYADCLDDIWNSINSLQANSIKSAIAKCNRKVEIEEKAAGNQVLAN